jgi:hypothetical protein
LGGPGFGGPGGFGSPGDQQQETEPRKIFVTAFEITTAKVQGRDAVNHPWGQTPINLTASIPGLIEMQVIKSDSILKRLEEQKKKHKDEPLKLVDWMLQHWTLPTSEKAFSMQAKLEEVIDELGREVNRFSAADQTRIRALMATKEQLRRPLPANDDIARIRALPLIGDEYRVINGTAYAVMHVSRMDKAAEVKLRRLDHAYAGFIYWFAMMGRPLTPPAKQLICLLADAPDKFTQLHKMFDSVPLVTDGFYSSLDNIIVLAPARVDGDFEQLKSKVDDTTKLLANAGLNLEKVLKPATIKGTPNADLLFQGQMMSLAYKSALEEGEVSTILHECFKQVAGATGLLPRRVQLPRSIREGIGSFYASPRSSGDVDLPALWSGVGGLHWIHTPLFKKILDAEKQKEPRLTFHAGHPGERRVVIDRLSVLKILTDEVFETADKADEKERAYLQAVAKAEAWGLFYWLSREKLDNLMRFYQELSMLPRDMDLSPEIIEQAFGRSFDLMGGSVANPQIDKTKLEALEKGWRDYMQYQSLALDTTAKAPPPPANPNQGGGQGGLGFPGGGLGGPGLGGPGMGGPGGGLGGPGLGGPGMGGPGGGRNPGGRGGPGGNPGPGQN